MKQVTLTLPAAAAAALLVLTLLPAEAAAGIVDSKELPPIGSFAGFHVNPRFAAALAAAWDNADEPATEEEAVDELVEEVENEVLPPVPAPAGPADDDHEKQVEPGQAWESRYRHGVAPAKLPALETDNAHGYRHSIIHPYGDDLHA